MVAGLTDSPSAFQVLPSHFLADDTFEEEYKQSIDPSLLKPKK